MSCHQSRRPHQHQPWNKQSAAILPVRPFKFSYTFLNNVIESEPTPKATIEKNKQILLRTVKNAKIVDYSERKNEEDFQVYSKLSDLFGRGKA